MSVSTPNRHAALTVPSEAGPVRGVPVEIDPAGDLGMQAMSGEVMYADSIYVTAQVETQSGHEFAFLAHVLRMPNIGVVRQTVSVTDKATGWYRHHTVVVPVDEFAWDRAREGGRLELRTPELTWTGDDRDQHLATTTPWGAIDVDLLVEGPVLPYGGVAAWKMLGHQQHQYAFPRITAKGTLTLEGNTEQVNGAAWLDRQWGPLPSMVTHRWSWMNFVLPDGDRLAIWDIQSVTGESADTWAHLLHADGSSELAALVPLADDADRFWTSPASGQVYPTRFVVRIPSFDAVLDVNAVAEDQELPAPSDGSLYEGAARFSGTFRGSDVSGDIYVEQVGAWH